MVRQHVPEHPNATGRQLKLFKDDPIFAIGAYFEAKENKKVLKLALPHSRRE
jgi:hypothetical protein